MRRRDREVTDIDEILRIVDKAKILHLGLFDTDYPYIVPLHYGYEYRDGNLIFYMQDVYKRQPCIMQEVRRFNRGRKL